MATAVNNATQRTGVVRFGDASLSVCEEGIPHDWDARRAWELAFKRLVFARIVQTLNRLGWTVRPQHYIFKDKNNRFCQKGDLKGDLHMMGRSITFTMFQSINCPSRPGHEGRHEWNKAACMPYVMRLEMERTRRRIRDYLLAVFNGYTFAPAGPEVGPLGDTALEHIERSNRDCWHFKPELGRRGGEEHSYNNKSADGGVVRHGARVWIADRKGRILPATAYYNINSMWWVITGRFSYTNVASFDIFTDSPGALRVKRNARLRRSRLEAEMQKAVAAMRFERAAVLRDILFPAGPVFQIVHKEHGLLFGPDYRGYTNDSARAGRYTREELKPYLGGELENERFKALEVAHG